MSISVSKKTQRIEWLDVAKGIAILLMVGGHSSLPDILHRWIFSFQMPLFFMASGYTTVWSREVWRRFCLRKLISLGRPFAIYSAICFTAFSILNLGNPFSWFNGWGDYALWFVPVIFVAFVIARFLVSISVKCRFVCAAALLLTSAVFHYSNMILPWNMAVAPYAAFFLLIGHYAKMFKVWIEHPTWFTLIGSLILTLVISHYWTLDMARNLCTPIIPLTIGAIAGTFFIFQLSVAIDNRTSFVSRILKRVGCETFLILAFSQIIIITLNTYFSLPVIVKYAILALTLILMTYAKNGVVALWRSLVNVRIHIK